MELPLLVFWESTVTDEDRSDRDDAVDRPLPLLIKGDSVLLLQVADSLIDCGPFSYENSMFPYYQKLGHIYYTDNP